MTIVADNQDAWRKTIYDSIETWTKTTANPWFPLYQQHDSSSSNRNKTEASESDHYSLLSKISRRSNNVGSTLVTEGNEFVYVDGVISTVEGGLFYMTEATTTLYSSAFNNSDSSGISFDNETTNSTSLNNFSSPYLMPWPQRSAWIAVFTLLVVVATVGNALVVWVVYGQFFLRLCALNFQRTINL